MIIITNNKYVFEKFQDSFNIIYNKDFTYMEVLKITRDKIHKGYQLITHPLSGSIKPNETPYKSIIVSQEKTDLHVRDIEIIGESILSVERFLKDKITPNWDEEILEDFRNIDLSVMENAIRNRFS